ncbi:ATP-binding protein [Dorea ammoniilytica]|uniref:ATP-binding protein n=1 Tax=Dorea ammoniilytica TaxID=2981788 RepID=A0ABT2S2K2_9FIRM|nr:ATP-binding protein [Dorea ammoniilytica]MCU6698801.1 ATP-binding protein [Dorea ammoniilytica]SCG97408.1 Predicted ATPase (AAA+ superfamily) [uncultured Eubacterium sp.]
MRVNELMLYRHMEQGQVLNDMAFLMENYDNEYYNKEDLRGLLFDSVNEILELAVSHGLTGNLWHDYLTFLLASDENAYSTSCEIVGAIDGSMNQVAMHDFAIFKELYDYDFTELEKALGVDCMSMLKGFKADGAHGSVFNKRIRDRICELSIHLAESENIEEFKAVLTQFYKEFGVGKFGLHKAFRIEHTELGAEIVPITKIAHVHLDDLVGYEMAKKKLIENTEAFVKGKKANNCLLFGDAGTGKSTSIKAILNQYYDQGLRMIEVYKHQFQDLNDVIAQIKNRNYKFIIYMDDLSFEEFEIEYKYLKAVIEGGLEKKPDNVLIYATSNRRHLIKETFKDKEDRDEELHTNDTVQEKLSLVARFGVTIFFGKPDKKQFQEIVRQLASRTELEITEGELMLEANKWELSHGGMSGRAAQQFVDYLLGTRL